MFLKFWRFWFSLFWSLLDVDIFRTYAPLACNLTNAYLSIDLPLLSGLQQRYLSNSFSSTSLALYSYNLQIRLLSYRSSTFKPTSLTAIGSENCSLSQKKSDYLLSWNPRAWSLPFFAFLVKVDLSFPRIIKDLFRWLFESQIYHQRHQISLQTSFGR